MRRLLEDLRMKETPADDLARPAPPPEGAGGGLTSPRGITAARPSFCHLRLEARPLCFIGLGLSEPSGKIFG